MRLQKFKLLILCIIFNSLTLLGCSNELDIFPEMENVKDDTRSVLIVGNSYSRDAFSYVPTLLEEQGIICDISILCINGNALSTHYDALLHNKARFDIDTYDYTSHRWYTFTDTTALQTISSKDWKLVIFQEGGNSAKDYNTVFTNVSNVKSYLLRALPKACYTFMINPPHPLGHSSLNGGSNNEEYSIIAGNAHTLLSEHVVSELVPCGTAIQNARQTDLRPLGDYGDLSYEGKHLQEGLPCLIEAYVGAKSIASFFQLPFVINYSVLEVNQTWVSRQHIPGRHGKAVVGDEDQYGLCKFCANNAINTPLQIFDSNK